MYFIRFEHNIRNIVICVKRIERGEDYRLSTKYKNNYKILVLVISRRSIFVEFNVVKYLKKSKVTIRQSNKKIWNDVRPNDYKILLGTRHFKWKLKSSYMQQIEEYDITDCVALISLKLIQEVFFTT